MILNILFSMLCLILNIISYIKGKLFFNLTFLIIYLNVFHTFYFVFGLGSHGHMKCVFDKQLQSQDVVLMSLFKRVFPKWTFDPYVPTPTNEMHDNHNMEPMM